MSESHREGPLSPAGSGTICQFQVRVLRHCIRLHCGWTSLLVFAILLSSQPWVCYGQNHQSIKSTLRLEWNNSTNRNWPGELRLTKGTILQVSLLDSDNSLTKILDQSTTDSSSRISFQTPAMSGWSGIEIKVSAPASAMVDLTIDNQRRHSQYSELLRGVSGTIEWDGWARIGRDPADILGIDLKREHMIFTAAESVEAELSFNLFNLSTHLPTGVRLELRRARDNQPLVSRDWNIRIPTKIAQPFVSNLTIHIPRRQGVYDLVVTATPENQGPIERRVQFVAIENSPNTPGSDELESLVIQTIDPNTSWAGHRLMPRTTRLWNSIWQSSGTTTSRPNAPIKLEFKNLGKPHILSIRFDNTTTKSLISSLSMADDSLEISKQPIVSGLRLSPDPSASGRDEFQMLVWPSELQAMLELHIPGQAGIDAIKSIKVEELTRGLPPMLPPSTPRSERLFTLYQRSHNYLDMYGRTFYVDPESGDEKEDWIGFLEATQNLIEFSKYAGFNSFTTPAVDGNRSLYPSKLLLPSALITSGNRASGSPDPMWKDLLTLQAKLAQSNDIGFVPSFNLHGVIPALEKQLQTPSSLTGGLVLISSQGKTWGELHPGNRRYNPLHPDVQFALIEIIREFVVKYGNEPSLRGIAINLTQESNCILPDINWGYDSVTIKRFMHDTGNQIPPGTDTIASQAKHINGALRKQWIAWRSNQLATLYEKIADVIHGVRPSATVILPMSMFNGSGQDKLRKDLRDGKSVDAMLSEKGMDFSAWNIPDGIVVLRPFVTNASRPEELHLNSSQYLDRHMASLSQTGSLCISESETHELEEQPTAHAELLTRRVTIPMAATTRASATRIGEAMAARDNQVFFVGGSSVPPTLNSATRDFAKLFRQLPRTVFDPHESPQPVAVRSHYDGTDTWAYIVSSAPFPVRTTLSFNCDEACVVEAIPGNHIQVQNDSMGQRFTVTIEPFGLMPVRFRNNEIMIEQCDIFLPNSAELGLKEKFERLNRAMNVLGKDQPQVLENTPRNGGFEVRHEDSPHQPASWTPAGEFDIFSLDASTRHSGDYALRLSGNTGVSVTSEEFDIPRGRALAAECWMSGSDDKTTIRWILTGYRSGQEIYRSQRIYEIGHDWSRCVFRIADLPIEQFDRLQMSFELVRGSALYLDDVSLSTQPISVSERRAILKVWSATFTAWRERRIADFQRLSNGYWSRYLIDSAEESIESEEKTTPQNANTRAETTTRIE